MVEGVGGIRYHHFHRNYTWVGKCPVGSSRLYVGTKAAKRPVSHGKKTAFADEPIATRLATLTSFSQPRLGSLASNLPKQLDIR